MKWLSKFLNNDCPETKPAKYETENIEQLISLMNMYLAEWSHRDAIIWKQVFAYFIACLVVMLLPFMTYFGINLGDTLPKWIFPAGGMVLAIFFYIVSRGYAIRLKAVGDIYQELIEKLPKDFQRKKVEDINENPIYRLHMCNLVVHVMFVALLIIGVVLLHLCW